MTKQKVEKSSNRSEGFLGFPHAFQCSMSIPAPRPAHPKRMHKYTPPRQGHFLEEHLLELVHSQ
jgi:hypothetical protein